MPRKASDAETAEHLAQRLRIAVAGERPAWYAVRGWALELAQTAERLQDPDTHTRQVQGVGDQGAMHEALTAAHDVLKESFGDDFGAILVVQTGQPGTSNYGRTVAASIANPFDVLRTIVEHNDPRGGRRG